MKRDTNLIKITLLISLILSSLLNSQEIFKSENIVEYLNRQNPFVSTILNQEQIAKEKIKYYEAPFDTTISGKYDYKDYPATTGKYSELFIKKRVENGIEFMVGYRDAEGTQEYNNIKTGDDGEILVGVKLPVIDLLQKANSYKIQLDMALSESLKEKYRATDTIRLLYFKVLNQYYISLYNKNILNLERELLDKAKSRREFIKKSVLAGSIPQLSLIEIEKQIINRELRLFKAENSYKNSFNNFLKLINLSEDDFHQKYILEGILSADIEEFSFDEVLKKAKENRPDIKLLEVEREKLSLEKMGVDLLKYPDLDLSIYGVEDFKYGSGFKVSLGLKFPVERSKYESKMGEYLKKIENLEELKKKIFLEIETSLKNLINSLKFLKLSIESSEKEVSLVKKLESAEDRKYRLGSSTLPLLNQREIDSLEIEKKLLQYKLQYNLLKEELKSEIGILNINF